MYVKNINKKQDFIELTKKKEKPKKYEKRKRQQDFTNQYKLETDSNN